jgi:hypothetical protein
MTNKAALATDAHGNTQGNQVLGLFTNYPVPVGLFSDCSLGIAHHRHILFK